MSETAKNNLGVLAFVSVIGLVSLIAYKIKDVSLSGFGATVDKITSILGTSDTSQKGFKLDIVTVLVMLVLLLTIVQLVRFRK